MKLTVVTVKQSTSKRSLKSRSDNSKDVSGIVIVIRMRLQNTVGKHIITLAGIRRNLQTGKVD